MWKLAFSAALSVVLAPSVFAQSTFHLFPQVADGSAGSFRYKSAVMIRNASDSATANCTLRLYGLQAAFITIRDAITGPIASFDLSMPPNGWAYPRTLGEQSLATGYATLS